jgi:hypothetical protein
VVSGVQTVVQAGGEAVDWLLTEAGQLALSGANALANLVGGSVTVGPDGLIIEIPKIELFDSHREEIIPPTPRVYVPLLAAGTVLGPVALVGSVGIPVSAPTWMVFLGPGRLQNIQVRIDPAASTYSATGEVYVGEAQNAYMQTGGAVQVDAITIIPTEPPIPVEAALEGGLLLTLQGSQVGSFARAVTLGYSSGAISLDLTHTLQLGMILEADLDAYLNAQLYGIEFCEFIWPLEHWEASKAETYSLPISLSFSGGAASITIGPVSGGSIPVEGIKTGLKRFRPQTKCKIFEEVIKELCKREILPPKVCEREEDEEIKPERKMLALAICKCMGPDPCGEYFYKCFKVEDNICKKHGEMQKKVQSLCNHDPEFNAHCQPSKNYQRHPGDYKCPVKEKECKDGYFGASVEGGETEEQPCALEDDVCSVRLRSRWLNDVPTKSGEKVNLNFSENRTHTTMARKSSPEMDSLASAYIKQGILPDYDCECQFCRAAEARNDTHGSQLDKAHVAYEAYNNMARKAVAEVVPKVDHLGRYFWTLSDTSTDASTE